MSRQLFNNITLVVMVILTVIILAVGIQTTDINVIINRIPELVIFSMVTALALFMSVPLWRSELSITHAVGLMAFLSLPEALIPPMTIAIFVGGTLGGIVRSRLEQSNTRYESPVWYATTIHTSARVTIAFFVSSFIYINFFDAPLPITDGYDFSLHAVPLIVTIGTYLALYLLGFALQVRMYERVRRILRENWIALTIILLLPVPFAVLGASVAQMDQSVVFFGVTIIGAVLIIFGLFVLNQTQQRLHRQLDEMRSLSVATQAMRGNLNLDGLLRTTYVEISQLLDISNFTVALYSDTEMRMTFPLVIREGQEIEGHATNDLPDDYPLIEYIMEQKQPLLLRHDVADKIKALGLPAIQQSINSWLGVPIITGTQPIGAFVIQATDQRRLDGNDLRVMNIIVASTGIAIENARLYSQKSVSADQLATLNRVTSLLTGTLSPNEVLNMVVSSASTVSDADAISIYTFPDNNSEKILFVRSAGLSDEFSTNPPRPLISEMMAKKQFDAYSQPESLLIQDLDDPKVAPMRSILVNENIQAIIEHPLIFGAMNIGVLVYYYKKPQRFTSERIDMIQAFSTQAAQAINNAQRFETADKALEQRVEQLYALAAMGRVINASVEIQKVYDVVLTYASDATKATRGFIALFRRSGRLTVPTQRGYHEAMFDDADFLQQGLPGRVLKNGQPIRVSDTRKETGYLPLSPQTRSMLAVPIMKGKHVLGMIFLESDQANLFSEGDAQFVAQIANQAVIAADNTQLFQRVKQARDNMTVILDAMQEGVILIDDTGHIIHTNPNISLIELSPEDLIDQAIDHLLMQEELKFAQHLGFSTPTALQHITSNLDKAWENHAPHDYEIHDDEFGVRYIQRQIIPVRDEDKLISGILLVFYNKSEEHELAVARESLSQMIVHDLRSPLTSVTTSLRLLQRLVPKEADFYDVVEQTTTMGRHAIHKVLSRVDSLLDIAKMESGTIRLDREPSHIRHIIDSVLDALAPLAKERDVTLNDDYDPRLPLVQLDADKIERVILNLVDNAIKYSPSGTDVTVNVVLSEPDFIRIEVADSGPGIPDEYKKKLFDRYVQIEGRKTVRRGVGLGLTFCKLVIEAHEGEIWVADNPKNTGSIFKATLPISTGTNDTDHSV